MKSKLFLLSCLALCALLLSDANTVALAQHGTTSGANPYAMPQGRVSTLANDLDRKMEKQNKSVSRLYKKGKKQMQKGKYDSASSNFEAALKYAPDSAQLNYITGTAHYLAGNDARALGLLDFALQSQIDPLTTDMQNLALQMLTDIKN